MFLGRKSPVFSAKYKKDRIAVEHSGFAIQDSRRFGIGVDREELRRELISLERSDGNDLVGQCGFFEE
jgi:hypothetical protein